MRTAGKRPKALPTRRIRTRDSRFVPTLTDRPQPAPWPPPSASLSARKHAACGDFQEPLPAVSRPGHPQKNFFQPLCRMPCGGPLLPCLLSRKDGTSIRPLLSSLFPAMPVPAAAAPAYRPAPCFPSSYKGMDLPAPHPGNRLPPHKKLLPMAGLPQPLLRSSSTQSHPHGIPTDDHAAHGNPTHPGRPPQPSIVRGKLRETHAPGASAARTLPSH